MMKVFHTSDLHLGYRQFGRMLQDGRDAREADVETTFNRVIALAIRERPDLVVVAGDVFHEPRPRPSAILAAYNGFRLLSHALPDTPIVIAAGNHDLARLNDVGDLLPLFNTLGIFVATRSSQRFLFPKLDLSVLAVPDAPMLARPALDPDTRARFNVLVCHGEVSGMLPAALSAERAAIEITKDEIGAEHWSYCAFGHFHVYTRLAPNAAYSGSIDYTSSDIWGEYRAEKRQGYGGKSIVIHDLLTQSHLRHGIDLARKVIDVDRVDATGMTPEQLNEAMSDAIEEHIIEDAIVRLRVIEADKGMNRNIDHKLVRSWKRRAFSFQLHIDYAEVERPLSSALHDSKLTKESLDAIVRRKIGERDTSAGVDRAELQTLGDHYMGLAREKDVERVTKEGV